MSGEQPGSLLEAGVFSAGTLNRLHQHNQALENRAVRDGVRFQGGVSRDPRKMNRRYRSDPQKPGYAQTSAPLANDVVHGTQLNAAPPDQPISLQLTAARTAPRLFAWFIDFLVFFALWVLLDWLATLFAGIPVVGLWLALAVYVFAVAIPLTAIRGQTIGQMVFGLAVVDAKGHRPPSIVRAAAHVVLSLVPIDAILLVLLVVVMRPFYERESEAGGAALEKMPKRLLHDRLAGTFVVDSNQPGSQREWEQWSRSQYGDTAIATEAARTAVASVRSGSSVFEASVRAHTAAVRAGGEYRCRPDRIRLLIAISVTAAFFLGLAALGLFLNPQPQIALAAILITLTSLPFAATWLVSRNSGFYLASSSVARRNWLDQTMATFPRSEVASADLLPAGTDSFWSWADFHVDHPQRHLLRGMKAWYSPEATSSAPKTDLCAWLFWWSDARFQEFQQVFGELRHAEESTMPVGLEETKRESSVGGRRRRH